MTSRRAAQLLSRAGEFSAVALRTVQQEFPNDIRSTMRFPGDFPNRPTDLHPAFYGCLDWHSCVQMHWLLIRLLRTVPAAIPADDIRAVLRRHLTASALATEAETFRTRPPRTRPYGWGWALTLHHEIMTWDDPDAHQWSANLAPLSAAVSEAFLRWLPKQTYPVRSGVHDNSAFGLSRALPYARTLAGADSDNSALLSAIENAAHRWFSTDSNYPAAWEPSGADFLSPPSPKPNSRPVCWPHKSSQGGSPASCPTSPPPGPPPCSPQPPPRTTPTASSPTCEASTSAGRGAGCAWPPSSHPTTPELP